VRGLGALKVYGLRRVLCIHVKAMSARIAAAMPEKRNQDHRKRQDPDRGADVNARTGVGVAAPLKIVVNHAQPDEDENQRPVIQQNGQRLEARTPIAHQEQNSDHNQDNWQNQ
jgi:hypothetical protein